MTTRRLMASTAATAGALLVAGVLVVRAFPLEAQSAQNLASKPAASAPVEIASGADHLLHASLPEYPRRALEHRVEGEVVLDLTIDDRGEVSDARVLSGPDELRRAALESVLQWHYSPEKVRSTSAQAALRFTVPTEIEVPVELAEPIEVREKEKLIAVVRIKEPEGDVPFGDKESILPDGGLRGVHFYEAAQAIEKAIGFKSNETLRLAEIVTERVPTELAKTIQDRAAVKIGDLLSEAALKRIVDAVGSVDEHFHVRWERDGTGGLIVFIIAP
jgi:TonB family protein